MCVGGGGGGGVGGVFDYILSLWLFKEEHLSDSGERNTCIQYW